jgi:hypothetical protein
MKKIILSILAAIILSIGLNQVAFVAIADNDLSTGTFNVNKILDPDLSATSEDGAYWETTKIVDGVEVTSPEPRPLIAFIVQLIEIATTIMGTLGMIILIIGGFMMMFAQGNQQKVDEAKDIVKYAVIGLSMAFLSYVIVVSVQSIFLTPQ